MEELLFAWEVAQAAFFGMSEDFGFGPAIVAFVAGCVPLASEALRERALRSWVATMKVKLRTLKRRDFVNAIGTALLTWLLIFLFFSVDAAHQRDAAAKHALELAKKDIIALQALTGDLAALRPRFVHKQFYIGLADATPEYAARFERDFVFQMAFTNTSETRPARDLVLDMMILPTSMDPADDFIAQSTIPSANDVGPREDYALTITQWKATRHTPITYICISLTYLDAFTNIAHRQVWYLRWNGVTQGKFNSAVFDATAAAPRMKEYIAKRTGKAAPESTR